MNLGRTSTIERLSAALVDRYRIERELGAAGMWVAESIAWLDQQFGPVSGR